MALFISSQDAIFTLSISTLYPTPQQLQGWAADEAFATEALAPTEVLPGIDGILSGGFVYNPMKQTITFQANSLGSIGIFETWHVQQQAQLTTFVAQGIIRSPALGRKWTLVNGFLTNLVPIPEAKKLLQPRRFELTWQSFQPSPL